jgi:hypothetical protein
MFACELLRGFATIEIVPTSTKETPEMVLYLPFQHHDSIPIVSGELILIEVREAQHKPDRACDGEHDARRRDQRSEQEMCRAEI